MQFTTRWMQENGWKCRHAETFWDDSGTVSSAWYVVESVSDPGFYAFGTKTMLEGPWGAPVDQCGTKHDCIKTIELWEREGLNYWPHFAENMIAAIESA